MSPQNAISKLLNIVVQIWILVITFSLENPNTVREEILDNDCFQESLVVSPL